MNRSTSPEAIIGAGLAGLLAGHAFPGVPILETSDAASLASAEHRALLRFRSEAVSHLTGIPFRRVRVRKGIWSEGEFRRPDVRLANLYARKCLDRVVGERSIWSIEAVDRWIAPENFPAMMREAMTARIQYGTAFDFVGRASLRARELAFGPVINTAPLSLIVGALLPPQDVPLLARAPIWTLRYRLPLADVHQTIYFPDHSSGTYRASMTGDVLIIELRTAPQDLDAAGEMATICRAFGIDAAALEPLGSAAARYGKIVELETSQRQALLAELTSSYAIYSLGRFATWRNVLLDDVVADADVIRRMLRARAECVGAISDYRARRATAGN